MRALLIHSPLVGPATMKPLATALEDVGWTVRVPDLRGAVASAPRFAASASRQPASDVVVGHSGAGAFLPIVASKVTASTTVFVDAILPLADTVYETPPAVRTLLDTLLVVDDVLPAWHEWWSPEVIDQLVPDEAMRARVIAEMPRVPRSFYAEALELPDRWWTRPAAYVQLSAAYDDERARAEAWGWPTSRLEGAHLDTVRRPRDVAATVRDLVAHTRPTS